MEENIDTNPTKPVVQENTPAPVSASSAEKPKKKSHKKLTIFFVILAILGFFIIFVMPLVLKAINPELKFAESVVNSCSSQCMQNKDASNACIISCLETQGTIDKDRACSAKCSEASNLPQCLLDEKCIP